MKDAASTALYGARGANGIIMVTTKKGKAGKATVTLDANGVLTLVLSRITMLSVAHRNILRQSILLCITLQLLTSVTIQPRLGSG